MTRLSWREGLTSATAAGGPWRRFEAAALLAVAYFLCAHAGTLLSSKAFHFTTFWLPAGLYVGSLLVTETRHWPAMLAAASVGNLAFDLSTGKPLGLALAFVGCNGFEALVGASLVRRFVARRPTLQSAREVIGVAALCAIVSPMLSASLSAALLHLTTQTSYWQLWRAWWAADLMGVLLMAPVVLTWTRTSRRYYLGFDSPKELAEAGLVICAMVGTVLVLSSEHPAEVSSRDYLLLPLLLWPAFRLGPRGVSWAALAMAIAVSWCATRGWLLGYTLHDMTQAQHGEGLQLFLGVFSFTGLVTGALLAERAKVRQSLLESQEHFRDLVEGTDNLVTQVDRHGRFTYVNKRAAALFGLDPQECLGRAAFDFVDASDRARTQQSFATWIAARPANISFENRQVGADGAVHDVLWSSNPHFDAAGELVLINSIGRDITERKRAEEALRESDTRKSEFLGVLSHELRNPMAPICNSLYVLERAAPDSTPARTAHTVIRRQVAHLTRLIDDLLDATRISQGKIRLVLQRIDLAAAVRRTIEDYRSEFAARGVELEERLGADEIAVSGDFTRITQIVGNLLGNAAKFTPRGGKVEIALERQETTALLRVRDSGVGIAPEMIKNLFQPFIQAPQTLARTKGGLGLVKGLVALHGGTVAAASPGPGQGAELTVRLPLAPQGSEAEAAGAVAAPAVRPRRVLVIEDSVDTAHSLADLLELDGHEVRVAYDGPSGLALAREFRPQVVFCDIGLPGMSGYQVAQELRADASLRGVVLAALTGYALPEDKPRATAAGFLHHIAKPPSAQALERVLREEAPAASEGEGATAEN
jgi:PAS domain S-box-containing protein